jgi:hypothetical protein
MFGVCCDESLVDSAVNAPGACGRYSRQPWQKAPPRGARGHRSAAYPSLGGDVIEPY